MNFESGIRINGYLRREGRQDQERNREKKKAADKQSGVGLPSENPMPGIESHETNREIKRKEKREEIPAKHRNQKGVSETVAGESREHYATTGKNSN